MVALDGWNFDFFVIWIRILNLVIYENMKNLYMFKFKIFYKIAHLPYIMPHFAQLVPRSLETIVP